MERIIIKKYITWAALIVIAGLSSCGHSPFTKNEQKILMLQQNRSIGAEMSFLKSLTVTDKFRLTLAIANSRDTLMVSELVPLVSDSSFLVRQGAAFALGQLPCKQSVSLLSQQLVVEKDIEAKKQIVLSLGKTGGKAELDAIFQQGFYLQFPVCTMRSLVYFFSRNLIADETVGFCVSFLESKIVEQRRFAAYAINRVRDKSLLEDYRNKLVSAANSTDPQVTARLIRPISLLDFQEKSRLFQKFIESPHREIKIELLRVLGDSEQEINLAVQARKDRDVFVKAAAVDFLAELDSLDNTTTETVKQIYDSASEKYLKSTALKCLVVQNGPADFPAIDALPDSLLKGYVEGLIIRAEMESIPLLKSLMTHHDNGISTPAYNGLLDVTAKFVDLDSLDFEELLEDIRLGLNSESTTQIALAAYTMQDTSKDFLDLIPVMLEKLKNLDKNADLDAITAILETIEIYAPEGGEKYLKPLLKTDSWFLRQKVLKILHQTYQADTENGVYKYHSQNTRLDKLAQHGLHPKVEMVTNRGSIVLELDGFYTPFTTESFLKLVDNGFYSNLIFHRVVPNFVIQGGDPQGDGWGGPGFTLLNERSPLAYHRGALGMASSGPDTEGSQFFITLSDYPHLDYNYVRFGQVLSGMEVADEIQQGDRIISIRVIKRTGNSDLQN